MTRLGQGQEIQTADPVPYFFGVARNVLRESWRRHPPAAPDWTAPSGADASAEALGDCLEGCLQRLAEPTRRLVLAYYREGKGSTIPARRTLAEQLGVTLPALRLRMHRVRARLEACVRSCTEAETESGPAPPRSRRESW
jgi:DNA-directed RNA polymerase specialized sigma24 family protein